MAFSQITRLGLSKRKRLKWLISISIFLIFIILYSAVYSYILKNLDKINTDDLHLPSQFDFVFYNTTEIKIAPARDQSILHRIPNYKVEKRSGPGEDGKGILTNILPEAQKIYHDTMKKWFMNLIAR